MNTIIEVSAEMKRTLTDFGISLMEKDKEAALIEAEEMPCQIEEKNVPITHVVTMVEVVTRVQHKKYFKITGDVVVFCQDRIHPDGGYTEKGEERFDWHIPIHLIFKDIQQEKFFRKTVFAR